MSEPADVSVIIPAWNAQDYLRDTINSVLQQDPKPKVIVVNDGSTDNTEAVAKEFDDILVITQSNAGCSASRITGLAMAETSKVIFLDADDILLPGAIRAHLNAFANNPDAVMVMGSNDLIDPAGVIVGKNTVPPFKSNDPEFIATAVTPCASQCMYSVKAMNKVGGYDPTLRLSEDVDLNLRLSAIGPIVCHGQFVMGYRLHPSQATKRPSKILRTHLGVLEKYFGPGGINPNRAIHARMRRHWSKYYGQNMMTELGRLLVYRNWKELPDLLNIWRVNFSSVTPFVLAGGAKAAAKFLRNALRKPATPGNGVA